MDVSLRYYKEAKAVPTFEPTSFSEVYFGIARYYKAIGSRRKP